MITAPAIPSLLYSAQFTMAYNARVGLAISCRRLPKLYPNVKAVTSTYAYLQDHAEEDYNFLAQTNVVMDDANPDYDSVIYVDYITRRHQNLRFDVWDVSDKDGKVDDGATLLGSVEISLVRLVRLRGQALNLLLLDEKQRIVGKGASIILRAVSIRREKQAPKVPPPPIPPVRFNWRRVKEWVFDEVDGFHDWREIPREHQTVENKCKGVVVIDIEDGKVRVSDLMNQILVAAGLPADGKDDSGDSPDQDSSDEDEMATLRRRRKEEEMTEKEKRLLKVHNKNRLDATLSVTSNGTTSKLRVVSVHPTDYDPTLQFLRDDHAFVGGSNSRALVTLHSHGFIVFAAPETTSSAAHSRLFSALKEHEAHLEQATKDGKAPEWNSLSASCRHCQAMINR